MHLGRGALAQLGERVVRNHEVRGSIPLCSTKTTKRVQRTLFCCLGGAAVFVAMRNLIVISKEKEYAGTGSEY